MAWQRWNATTKIFEYSTNQGASWAALVLDGAVINQGKIALARGGTNADLSGTGGASKFLRQNSAGAAIDVVQPGTADLIDRSSFRLAKLLSSNNFNDGSLHGSLGQVAFTCGFLEVIEPTSGTTYIPFWANGGGGVSFRWSYVDPDTGFVSNSAGPSFSYTQAGTGGNTYTVAFDGSTGQASIQRTAGAHSYTIGVYTFQ